MEMTIPAMAKKVKPCKYLDIVMPSCCIKKDYIGII